MIRAAEAKKLILENTNELGRETVGLMECLDKVLADDIFAGENLPPFNNSAMDGFAVVAAKTQGASFESPLVLKIAGKQQAGHATEQQLKEGQAIKIMTGAPLPEGADAVVKIEETKQEGSQVSLFREAKQWQNIRFIGEDIKKGQLVLPKGKLLGAADIGMLAALNRASVDVIRTPAVSILATGDELTELGEGLLPGKIRNINSYSLQALLMKHGVKPNYLGIAGDQKEEIEQMLNRGINSDILVTSGGVSVGDWDYVKDLLRSMGMKEIFWRIAVKPGKPVLFGVLGQTLVFGLPGNPVSSMVSMIEFVLPAIYKMQGKKTAPYKEMIATVEEDYEKRNGLLNFVRGKAILKDGRISVKALENQSSGSFSSMVYGNCLMIIPEGVRKIEAGEEVLIQVLDDITE